MNNKVNNNVLTIAFYIIYIYKEDIIDNEISTMDIHQLLFILNSRYQIECNDNLFDSRFKLNKSKIIYLDILYFFAGSGGFYTNDLNDDFWNYQFNRVNKSIDPNAKEYINEELSSSIDKLKEFKEDMKIKNFIDEENRKNERKKIIKELKANRKKR